MLSLGTATPFALDFFGAGATSAAAGTSVGSLKIDSGAGIVVDFVADIDFGFIFLLADADAAGFGATSFSLIIISNSN